MVDSGVLDSRLLDWFWRFVHDRQRVWTRRVIDGANPPWSDDTILQRYRFTNVYRVLDPGTQYAINGILERDESARDKLFNVLLYRLIGREETHRQVGFQRVGEFEPTWFESILKARRDTAQNAVFTGAYLVSGYASMGSSDKIENITTIFDRIATSNVSVLDAVLAAESMPEAYGGIHSLPGFGKFLSYQVLVDLLYPIEALDGRSVLPFSQNEWVMPGPGAMNGIEILGGEKSGAPAEVIEWLRTRQRVAFEQRGLRFPYRLDPSDRVIELTLADIQNCLCEFYKYHKIRTGTGRGRRRFRIEDARSQHELRALYQHSANSFAPRAAEDDS